MAYHMWIGISEVKKMKIEWGKKKVVEEIMPAFPPDLLKNIFTYARPSHSKQGKYIYAQTKAHQSLRVESWKKRKKP